MDTAKCTFPQPPPGAALHSTTMAADVKVELDAGALMRRMQEAVYKDKTKDDKEVWAVKNELTPAIIEEVIRRATPIIRAEPMRLEVKAPVYCVGDIHGQFTDLMRIFKKTGWPDGESRRYLFLGDYVDRGPNSLECIVFLLLVKVIHPSAIYLLRGNHECSAVNRVYGFYEECCSRFPENHVGRGLWDQFQDLFNWMPMTALISRRILCMHGGISQCCKLNDIERPVDPFAACLAVDLLWADPSPQMANGPLDPLYEASARGISHHFSKRALQELCKKFSIDLVVRGHQVVQDGYEFFAHRHLVTVFSAPNYCGTFNNFGALLYVDWDCQCSMTTFPPDPLAPKGKGPKAAETTIDEMDIDDGKEEGGTSAAPTRPERVKQASQGPPTPKAKSQRRVYAQPIVVD
ncbi:unnamed protein product, partial [Mesorhabditis spiculigera]